MQSAVGRLWKRVEKKEVVKSEGAQKEGWNIEYGEVCGLKDIGRMSKEWRGLRVCVWRWGVESNGRSTGN